jgi:hypothetical protein
METHKTTQKKIFEVGMGREQEERTSYQNIKKKNAEGTIK